MNNAPAWLRREIKDGLQALVALSLEKQPAADVLPLTADIWLRAVLRGSIGIDIEEIDAPRIREGFDRLFPVLVEWPAPKQLLDKIPGRPEREKLPEPPATAEQNEAAARQLKTIMERLEDRFNVPAKPPLDEEARRRQLRQQARQLREGGAP